MVWLGTFVDPPRFRRSSNKLLSFLKRCKRIRFRYSDITTLYDAVTEAAVAHQPVSKNAASQNREPVLSQVISYNSIASNIKHKNIFDQATQWTRRRELLS